jgi:hypothetical protein
MRWPRLTSGKGLRLVRVAEEWAGIILRRSAAGEPLLPGVRWVLIAVAALERSSFAPRSTGLGTWQIGLRGWRPRSYEGVRRAARSDPGSVEYVSVNHGSGYVLVAQ